MATYHNDYSKKSDKMMWELHEIRHKMQNEGINADRINDNAKKIVDKWTKKQKKIA